MKRILFKVNGIRNNTEKNQIKNALDKIPGVHDIIVDKLESSIDVEYNEPATVGEIKDTIVGTGHDTQENEDI